MSTYAVVLQAAPESSQAAIVAALAKAFGIKEATSTTVTQSTPIILIDGLSLDEAAAMQLVLASVTRAGATIDIGEVSGDLPKIDWPKQPMIFKREIADHLADYQMTLAGTRLIDMLLLRLTGQDPGSGRRPAVSTSTHSPASGTSSTQRSTFIAAELGEITPFSNAALDGGPGSGGYASPNPSSSQELGSRMDELFPDEDEGQDGSVGSILDQIMPPDDATNVGGQPPSGPQTAAMTPSSGNHRSPGSGVFRNQTGSAGDGGWSVFLAKIADPNRREKAVPLLSELAGIDEDEAQALSKKVIIPVLRGVSKEAAEAAKHRFAEIGVLARVRSS